MIKQSRTSGGVYKEPFGIFLRKCSTWCLRTILESWFDFFKPWNFQSPYSMLCFLPCFRLLCRLTYALCLNFLAVIHLDGHVTGAVEKVETSFTKVKVLLSLYFDQQSINSVINIIIINHTGHLNTFWTHQVTFLHHCFSVGLFWGLFVYTVFCQYDKKIHIGLNESI